MPELPDGAQVTDKDPRDFPMSRVLGNVLRWPKNNLKTHDKVT
jgi:hypothetical protein